MKRSGAAPTSSNGYPVKSARSGCPGDSITRVSFKPASSME